MAPSNVDLRWRCKRGSAAYSTRKISGWQEDSAQLMTPACPLWLLPDSYKKSETRLSPALPRRLVNKTSRQRLGAKTVVVERRFGILDLSERRRLPGQQVCVRFLFEGGPIGLSRLSGYMQFAEKEWWISIA